LRRNGFGGLRSHPVRLRVEYCGLLLGVRPFALAASLVGLALGQVSLPPDVVDVEHGAGGVEVKHLVDGDLEQLDIVADHHETTPVPAQEVTKPDDRVGVEVVGGLV